MFRRRIVVVKLGVLFGVLEFADHNDATCQRGDSDPAAAQRDRHP